MGGAGMGDAGGDAAFQAAVTHVRGLPAAAGQPGAPTNAQRLRFYGLFKQASEGDAPSGRVRPGILAVVARAKFDSWAALRGKTPEEARRQYVELLQALDPAFIAPGERRGAGEPFS